MDINEYLQKHKVIELLCGEYSIRKVAPRVKCQDGFSMSVQVGEYAYCLPRENNAYTYTQVEVGYPSEREELLDEWVERWDDNEPDWTRSVYGYVPIEVVDKIIEKHGGYKEEE